MSKAIVMIDIPTDYADEYKQWLIDGRLYYLEDDSWTYLKEVECEVEPYREAIPVHWILHYVDTHYNVDNYDDIWRYIMKMHDDWEKENEID